MEDRFTKLKARLDAEVNLLTTPEIRDLTRKVLEGVPGRVWTNRASKKYHPEDERGYCGNLLHTLKVVRVFRLLISGIKHEPWEEDAGVSAALLHDSRRFGKDSDTPYTAENHAEVAGKMIGEAIVNMALPYYKLGAIVEAVTGHMGKWQKEPYYIPALGIPLGINLLLVLADHIAAQTWVRIDIGVEI